ncbi:hypothetical protein SAMN04488570_1418 [Nocardioides scoriae]|uniref:Membrane protein YfhO n=1 Tax=Nocardioides scoriae TaxID=642780 RepID=A0A1H1QHR9_9ACTN|nr:hypothetical protein [Nocardioides scoriae]SDS22934.1 hypothetical protein SAMN04488570_1418 [Nocardioides scoriae]
MGSTWRRRLPVVWVLVLAVVLLGPALLPGHVLTYDMVWVPDLALTRDALGVGSALPRAVPSDAVVAVLDEVVPGQLLQHLVLLGTLVGAGLGVLRLADRGSLVAQLVSATAYVWNPFVVERLVMGHWPVLVGYAVAPWVVSAVLAWRRSGVVPASLWGLVPLGSLSASTGLVTALLLLATTLTVGPARRGRGLLVVAATLLVANAPWLVSGLLHASVATTDAGASSRFALQDEGGLPGPLAALTLGGIWNAEVVPASRLGVPGWLWLAAVVVLVVLGATGLRRRLGTPLVAALAGCAVLGWGAATLSWVAPTALGSLAASVPGGGVLRDSTRLLALVAPGLALVLGEGAARLVRALPAAARPGLGVALVLLPVATLPDAGLGAGGRLEAVELPADLAAARAVVAGLDGDVVLLPFSSYRQPAWNGDRKVLDPTGRALGRDFVADDALSVGGRVVPGEDPRARAVGEALRQGDERARADALRDLGIGVVVTERDAGEAPAVAGRTAYDGDVLLVQALGDVAPPVVPRTWVVAMTLAWAAYVGALVAGTVLGLLRAVGARRGRRHEGRTSPPRGATPPMR